MRNFIEIVEAAFDQNVSGKKYKIEARLLRLKPNAISGGSFGDYDPAASPIFMMIDASDAGVCNFVKRVYGTSPNHTPDKMRPLASGDVVEINRLETKETSFCIRSDEHWMPFAFDS